MRLGEYQELVCVKKVDFGIYVPPSSASKKRKLLRANKIRVGENKGENLKVFK